MAKRLNMIVLSALVILVGAIFQGSEAQTTHIVGDSIGWRIPPGDVATYTTWASQQTFAVGDVLVFNFVTNTHDVAEVTKSSYDNCTVASPISSTTTGPASITLSSSGDHHFICRFSGHCNAGQKLTVTVAAAATPPPTAATPPPTTATSPPPTTVTSPTTTTTTPPPTTTAMPPTTTATPPATTATPPMTAATPPPRATATQSPPPTTSNVPSTQSPSGSMTPPPPAPSSATSFVPSALPVAFLLSLVFLH